MANLRTILTEPSVDESLESIFQTPQFADEALRGFHAVLCRSPEAGTQISENVWFMAMDGRGIWKSVAAYYTFTDNEVSILKIVEVK